MGKHTEPDQASTTGWKRWDVDSLPHYSSDDLPRWKPSEEVATAMLLDIVTHRSGTAVVPTTAALGLADPREVCDDMQSLADLLTILAHDAELEESPLYRNLALAAGRAGIVLGRLFAMVELGAVA